MLKLQYFVQLMRRDPDAEKDCSQKDKGVAGNEMVRWHHQLNGLEFEQSPGDSEGQGCLSYARCSPWGYKKIGHD